MFEHEGEICNCDIGGNMTPDWIRVSGKKIINIATEAYDYEDSSRGSRKIPVTVIWEGGEHGFEDIEDAMECFGVTRSFIQLANVTGKQIGRAHV